MTRRLIHRRTIQFEGFGRDDGLYEVEATLLDVKTDDFEQPADKKVVPAGAPIHQMKLVLVVDLRMVIHEVRTEMQNFPYVSCVGGGETLQSLVGVRIGAGWNSEVRKRLPVCDTCTHLREILTPMATAVYQTLTEHYRHTFDDRDAEGPPRKLDSCRAYGANRALVAALWPAYARGTPES